MEKPKQAFLANPILKEKYNAPSRPLPLLRSLISGSFPLNKVCVLEKRQQRKGPRPLSYLTGLSLLSDSKM